MRIRVATLRLARLPKASQAALRDHLHLRRYHRCVRVRVRAQGEFPSARARNRLRRVLALRPGSPRSTSMLRRPSRRPRLRRHSRVSPSRRVLHRPCQTLRRAHARRRDAIRRRGLAWSLHLVARDRPSPQAQPRVRRDTPTAQGQSGRRVRRRAPTPKVSSRSARAWFAWWYELENDRSWCLDS